MPRLLETRYWRLQCGCEDVGTGSKGDASWGHLRPNTGSLDAKVDSLVRELSEDGWEIKSVTPLTGSYYYSASTFMTSMDRTNWGGYGVGYGAPYTDGVLVLAQRWNEVSEAVIAERERLAAAKAAEKAAADLDRRRAARAAEIEALRAKPIKKAGLLRDKWRFGDADYPTEDLALSAKSAEIERLRTLPI